MGGCNSSPWSDVMLGASFILAGAGAVATDGASLAANLGSAGALGGAYFSTKKSCGKSTTALIQATREIISTAVVLSINQCASDDTSLQGITITCNPNLASDEVYEQNAACGTCNRNVFDGVLSGHQQEREVWNRGGSVKVRLPIDDEYVLTLGRIGTCGMISCKACSLANVTQANILNINSNCYQQVESSTNFQNNLTGLVQQQLLSNQDVLAGAAQVLGERNVSKLTERIVDRISSNVNSTFLNQVVAQMKSSQIIQIDSGTSVSLNNISQYNAFNVVLNEVTEEQVVEKSINTAVFASIAQIANQQNTLNDVGEVVFEATVDFTKAVDNSVGQVMFAVLAALGAVVLAIIGYAIYKFVKRTAKDTEDLARTIDQQRSKMAALQQF